MRRWPRNRPTLPLSRSAGRFSPGGRRQKSATVRWGFLSVVVGMFVVLDFVVIFFVAVPVVTDVVGTAAVVVAGTAAMVILSFAHVVVEDVVLLAAVSGE